jgi:hypothetical protein
MPQSRFRLVVLVWMVLLLMPVQARGAARTIAVTGSLQAAVDAAQPGDVLILGANSYAGPITLGRAGTPSAPITLRGAGRGKTVLRGTLKLRAGAAFWRIEDLDIDAQGSGDGVRIEPLARDITLRRLHIHGGRGYGVRVGSDTTNLLIEASQIDHFSAGNADAHGVGIMTASNVTIRDCDIHHNSGDAIQVNTPDFPGYGRFASNILIERNQLHDGRENALDIKSTRGLTARANQMWGFDAVTTSDGMAIQVQYDAQDISIVGNHIWGALEGIEVSRGRKNGIAYPLAPRRVLIAGNLFQNLPPSNGNTARPSGTHKLWVPLAIVRAANLGDGDGGRGSGIVIRASAEVRVYNNTILDSPRLGMYLASSGTGDYPSAVDIRNNVLDGGVDDLAFAFAPGVVAGLLVDYNHYANGRVNGASLKSWLALGYERHATAGDPELDTAFLPRDGSPLIDSGVDVGLSFAGTAPDRGWGENH